MDAAHRRMTITPVLLPGNMCDARLWRGGDGIILDCLRQSGFAEPVDADLAQGASIAAMAARTLTSVEGDVLPIGFSMGAIVAMEMWCQSPERIKALVLLGYNATADLPERAAHRPAQQADVSKGGLERVLIKELKPNYLGATQRGDTALLGLLREMGLALGPDVFIRQSEALRLRADRRETLPAVTVPVLFGSGAEDSLCPPAWHADWASRIPDAENFVVYGAGHMLPLENPEALAAHLERWFLKKDIA
jgi:pimeloyl-ACP methyl ester carboxylesterase